MARLKIKIRSNSFKQEVGTQLHDLLKDKLLKDVRLLLQTELDKEIGKIFIFISNQILKGYNFKSIQKYLPKPWEAYSEKYARRKKSDPLVGHLRWFNLSKELGLEFGGVSERVLINALGSSKISISRNKSIITAKIAPNVKLQDNFLENELANLDLLSEEAVFKLNGRSQSYRSMVGPVFDYFMRDRLPKVVRRVVKGV
jgi:hypothetical protein